MITIPEYLKILCETPIARSGDWDGAGIGTTSELIHRKDWKALGLLKIGDKSLTVARHTNSISYLVGIPLDTGQFQRLFHIRLEPSRQIGQRIGFPKLYSVVWVMTSDDLRGAGIATEMYKWLCHNLGPIMSDREQYFGARRVWAKLSRDPGVRVDVVNLDTSELVETGTTLHQGNDDGDFDNRYWSNDAVKEPFRFVVTPA